MNDREKIDARVGTVLGGKYRLIRVLGAGGMGAVYEGENTRTGRRVALKVMLGAGKHDREWIERFQREARAATKIAHPNIVDVLDLGDDDVTGATYIVQEFLGGSDLRRLLDERQSVSPREALEILVPVMSALVAAHRHGVVHRDIKPENIFLAKSASGAMTPKLIDFGIAKFTDGGPESANLTRTGAAMGTPYYMSPEQARGEKNIDAQTDVWAIGALLFEMLAGRCPFEGDNYNAVLAQILTEKAPRLDVVQPRAPRPLADVVEIALERDRAKRFRTMGSFLAKLLDLPEMADDDWFRTLRSTHRGSATPSGAASLDDFAEEDTVEAQKPLPGALEAAFARASREPAPPGVRARASSAKPESGAGGSSTTLGRSARSLPVTGGSPPTRAGLWVITALVAVGASAIGIAAGLRSRTDRGASARSSPSGAPTSTARSSSSASSTTPSTTNTVVAVPPTTFNVVVTVRPSTAQVTLDDEPVGTGVFARALPRDGREHRLALRAPGFAEQIVVFRDVPPPERIVLTALPTAQEAPPRGPQAATRPRPSTTRTTSSTATGASPTAVPTVPPTPPATVRPPRTANGAPLLEQ